SRPESRAKTTRSRRVRGAEWAEKGKETSILDPGPWARRIDPEVPIPTSKVIKRITLAWILVRKILADNRIVTSPYLVYFHRYPGRIRVSGLFFNNILESRFFGHFFCICFQ